MISDGDVPHGFGMGLMKDTKALDAFSMLTDQQKQRVLPGIRNANSLEEMLAYVDWIVGGSF
jgi:hypothetical protein